MVDHTKTMSTVFEFYSLKTGKLASQMWKVHTSWDNKWAICEFKLRNYHQNCDSWFNKDYDVETNTSHAEKIKKISEDSKHNFENGADSELDKDTDRSKLNSLALPLHVLFLFNIFYRVQLL